jgi:hypothetical protein
MANLPPPSPHHPPSTRNVISQVVPINGIMYLAFKWQEEKWLYVAMMMGDINFYDSFIIYCYSSMPQRTLHLQSAVISSQPQNI